MSDVLKSIADDLNKFGAFLEEAGIKKEFANVGPYCARAKHARNGFDRGFRGRQLLAYVGKELVVADLVKQIDKLESDFDTAVSVDKNIEALIQRGMKSDPT